MAVRFLDPKYAEQFRDNINNDPEFKLAARFMTKDVLLGVGDSGCIVSVNDGVISKIKVGLIFLEPWSFAIKASVESWEKFLQPIPSPGYNGLFAAMINSKLQVEGNLEAAFAHFWAMTRMLDILRQLQNR